MKPDEKHGPCSSRRDFLKRTVRATGYAIPTVMIFTMKSSDVWAQNYETRSGETTNATQSEEHDHCKTFFDKIFRPQCW